MGTAVITEVDTVGTPTFCEVKEIFVINRDYSRNHAFTLEYSHHYYYSWIVRATEELTACAKDAIFRLSSGV